MNFHARILIAVLMCPDAAWAQIPANPTVLENDYVRVSRDSAPCASAATPGCGDRVIVSMGELELVAGEQRRRMKRGDIAIFKPGESFTPPSGAYFEVAIKPNHPPVKSPPELIPPPKNLLVFEGTKFFIYEEKLDPGDTRQRHSHSQRIEIRINQGPRLEQQIWRDGNIIQQEPPSIVNWREPVIHIVKNVGDMPLRNFILEFLPERREGAAR
jgi:hypothetical protein